MLQVAFDALQEKMKLSDAIEKIVCVLLELEGFDVKRDVEGNIFLTTPPYDDREYGDAHIDQLGDSFEYLKILFPDGVVTKNYDTGFSSEDDEDEDNEEGEMEMIYDGSTVFTSATCEIYAGVNSERDTEIAVNMNEQPT